MEMMTYTNSRYWTLGLITILVSAMTMGCKSGPETPAMTVLGAVTMAVDKEAAEHEPEARQYFLEEVNGIALVQLYADGFEELELKEKLLAYYLYKASLAGRDIAFDQKHRYALTVRQLLGRVLSHPLGIAEEAEAALRTYTKFFWLNNGPYSERNKTKLLAPFSRTEFAESLGIARANGAQFDSFGSPLHELLSQLDGLLWDPQHEPLATNKNPGPHGDILRDSANNLYEGVTTADLEGFKERYPLNSRVTKKCPKRKPCAVVEQVYRFGKKDEKGRKWVVEPGLYAAELAAVAGYLEKAIPYAEAGQAVYLEKLIEFFKTGDPKTFDEASIAWLKQDPAVDVIIGFIETYKDARGQKGEWEGLVYYTDRNLTGIMKSIADNAAYFEKRAPWADKYKKQEIRIPVATAINVLMGVGGAGPSIPLGINLPNAQWIREKHGSRSVLLSNVLAAARAAVSDKALREFALPEEVPVVRKYREAVGRTMVALHEVVGHGSGKAGPLLTVDPSEALQETYSTIEEARAELVALHHVFDPKLIEIGALPNGDAGLVAYADYIRKDLLQLRRVKTGSRFEDDHMRATHLIVQYIMDNSKAVKILQVEGKTYYALVDAAAARKAVATLLTEVMRIKAVGDVASARALVARYAIDFDPALRDEVVKRAKAAGVPDFVAFHVPEVKLVIGDDGAPSDVVLDYSKDFLTTMLEWDLLTN
jgi:dipeptidyl-peptidase III